MAPIMLSTERFRKTIPPLDTNYLFKINKKGQNQTRNISLVKHFPLLFSLSYLTVYLSINFLFHCFDILLLFLLYLRIFYFYVMFVKSKKLINLKKSDN